MDFGTHPYKTKVRPFRDSDQEVTIEWYEAAPGAPMIDKIFAIGHNDFAVFPWNLKVGEVYGAKRPYTKNAPPRLFVNYDHVCGSDEDFMLGAVYDPAANYQYTWNNIPVCCNPVVIPRGGFAAGGTAVSHYCEQYRCDVAIVGHPLLMFRAPGFDFWQPAIFTFPYGMLFAPDVAIPGEWLMRVFFNLGVHCDYSTAGSWDGHGARVFNPYPLFPVPPCGATATVTCV